MWFCSFWPFVLFRDVFDRFLLLSDKSQASSGSINPFYDSRASIWAQAQPSSSICSEVMTKTMASIAPKMTKMTTTFIVVIRLTFLKMRSMKDFVMIRSCFTKVLRAKNRWETLSTLTFDLVVSRGHGVVHCGAWKSEHLLGYLFFHQWIHFANSYNDFFEILSSILHWSIMWFYANPCTVRNLKKNEGG